jgi:hypothetical protein
VGRSIGGLIADVNLRYMPYMPLGICQIIEALQSCTLAGECRFRFVADESCIQAVQVVQKLRRENSFEDRTVEAHFCRLITLAIGALQLSHTTFGGTSFLFVPVNVMAFFGNLPRDRTNQASGLINVSRNIVGSMGISFVTTLYIGGQIITWQRWTKITGLGRDAGTLGTSRATRRRSAGPSVLHQDLARQSIMLWVVGPSGSCLAAQSEP